MDRDISKQLTRTQLGESKLISVMIARGESADTIQSIWKDLVAKINAKVDIHSFVQYILRESYLEQNKDLQLYAAKVKYYNDMKKQVRDEIERTRKLHQDFMDCLEQNLSSIGDDAQLANIDLQDMLQRQQQILQTMSNVSKMLHDTAMAIIRKIG
jgi:citrate synthase